MNDMPRSEDSDEEVPLAEVIDASIPVADSVSAFQPPSARPAKPEALSVYDSGVVLLQSADDDVIPVASFAGVPTAPIRRGSPFVTAVKREWSKTREQRFTARGAAIGSIVIGAWTCFTAFFPFGPSVRFAIILNLMFGLTLGLWGLAGVARKQALIGLGVCLLGLVFAIAGAGLELVYSR